MKLLTKKKKFKYKPYLYDFKYEKKTYKNVGRDYGNFKTANLGFTLNLVRYLRNKKNKNNRKYQVCNTYSDWKKYLIDKNGKSLSLNEKYLCGLKQEKFEAVEINKTVVLGIEIALISVYFSSVKFLNEFQFTICFAVVLSFLATFMTIAIKDAYLEYNLVCDCIEILKIREKKEN